MEDLLSCRVGIWCYWGTDQCTDWLDPEVEELLKGGWFGKASELQWEAALTAQLEMEVPLDTELFEFNEISLDALMDMEDERADAEDGYLGSEIDGDWWSELVEEDDLEEE